MVRQHDMVGPPCDTQKCHNGDTEWTSTRPARFGWFLQDVDITDCDQQRHGEREATIQTLAASSIRSRRQLPAER